jgi:hypothetical protein
MDKALAVALVLLAPAGASAQAANWFQIYDKIDGFSLYMSNQSAVLDERRLGHTARCPAALYRVRLAECSVQSLLRRVTLNGSGAKGLAFSVAAAMCGDFRCA